MGLQLLDVLVTPLSGFAGSHSVSCAFYSDNVALVNYDRRQGLRSACFTDAGAGGHATLVRTSRGQLTGRSSAGHCRRDMFGSLILLRRACSHRNSRFWFLVLRLGGEQWEPVLCIVGDLAIIRRILDVGLGRLKEGVFRGCQVGENGGRWVRVYQDIMRRHGE